VADFVIDVLQWRSFGPGQKWVDDIVEFSFPSAGGLTANSALTPKI
jgi:hypothetical protein